MKETQGGVDLLPMESKDFLDKLDLTPIKASRLTSDEKLVFC